MGLESATFISDLVPTNPTGLDPRSEGDDHLRLIKEVLQNTFTGTGEGAAAVGYLPTGTGAVATNVQTQLRQTRNAANYDTLANFFAGASGYDNFIPAGTYTLTSLLTLGVP